MLLALDTSMACCSAALYDPVAQRLVAAEALAMDKGHAEALAPMVGRVLAAGGKTMADLTRLAVTTGPGTFTGLRIALSFAQGLGLARGLPVAGVNSLWAMAAPLLGGTPVLVASDARLGECYAALYDGDGHEMMAPARFAVATLAEQLPPTPLAVAGSAADAVLAAARRHDLLRAPGPLWPVAQDFAAPAATLPLPRAMPRPLYLKPADARPQARNLRPLSELAIETVAAAHGAVLAALHGECFAGGWTAGDIANLLTLPGAIALLARDRGEPVGFVLAQCAADEAEIITICTRPAQQRRGAGHAVLSALMAALAAAGTKTLFLDVAADNTAARALYEAHGFVQVGLRPRDYTTGRALYEAHGFVQVGLRPRYYTSGRDRPVDALLMRRRLA